MPTDLAWKLRLTAAMLGCGSRKDLAAAFRAANPRTGFALDRAHKWLQGRAAPRDATLYADWAAVLGTARPPAWVASCSRAAFLAEVCHLAQAEPAVLEARAAAIGAAAPPDPAEHYLCGDFAAYSHAWSSAQRGRLIRGALALRPGRAGRFALAYTERIVGGTLRLAGTAELSGRVLHGSLRDRASGGCLFLTLQVPGRPAAAIAGVMSGATFASADPEPSATLIVLLRIAPGAAQTLEEGNRYLAPEALAADIAALGMPGAAAAAIARVLGEGFTQVAPAESAALAAAAGGLPAVA